MTLNWPDFYLPPINLWHCPKQHRDYKMNEETTCKPQWVIKEVKADDAQVDGDHYKNMNMQPWEVMELVLTEEEFVGYLKGNIIKYTQRDGKKIGAAKDGAKALHYKQKLLEIKQEREK
jgi:hypothetical protein